MEHKDQDQGNDTTQPPNSLPASAKCEDAELKELEIAINQIRADQGIDINDQGPKPIVARSRYPVMTPEQIAAREEKRLEDEQRQIQVNRWNNWASLLKDRGNRYESCLLGSFETKTEAQKRVVAILWQYCETIKEAVRDGRGVLLFGPRGTGKDHLAMAVCRAAIAVDLRVTWQNGMDFFGDVRDSFDDDTRTERSFVQKLTWPDLLYLSDPLPPTGKLTQFQSSFLFRVLDARYNRRKPVICTVNVSGRDELDERMGTQNSDRLRDQTLALWCNWESYRKVVDT